MLTRKFLKEIFTQEEVDSIIQNYDYAEKIFRVKRERNNDFYKEFINKIFGFYKLPVYEYNKYKERLNFTYKKIDKFKKHVELQINENLQKLEKLNKEICKINADITRRKDSYEDYVSLMKKKEKYVFVNKIRINNYIKKCKHYLNILEDEVKSIKQRWDDNYIRKCSIRKAQDEKINDNLYINEISLINTSERLFLPECDYSVNVKFFMQTMELINEIKRKSVGLELEEYKKLVKGIIEKNEYDSRKMEELKSTDINEYLNKLKKYIEENNIYDYILENTKKNHAINYRYNVIEDAINLFKNNKYETFISLVAIQVEGIFHDYCKELEILPRESSKFTLGTKLSEINENIYLPFYEYYKFDFEILRNKIAHGFIIQDETELLAHELLLDLLALIYEINNNDNNFPYLVAIKFLQDYSSEENVHLRARLFNTSHKDECLIDYIKGEMFATDRKKDIRIRFNYILNPMYDEIYDFYDNEIYGYGYLKSSILSVRDRITSKEFWDFVYKGFIKGKLKYMDKQEKNMWIFIIDNIMLPYLNRNNYDQTKKELAMIGAKIKQH